MSMDRAVMAASDTTPLGMSRFVPICLRVTNQRVYCIAHRLGQVGPYRDNLCQLMMRFLCDGLCVTTT